MKQLRGFEIVAFAVTFLAAPPAIASLPTGGQTQFRYTRYVGYVVSQGDNPICTSLKPSACPQGAVAFAQRNRPAGGVDRKGNPTSNQTASGGAVLYGAFCLVAGIARAENLDKERDGVPIARADIRYLPQMLGASGASGLSSSMWSVVSAHLPTAGKVMRGVVSVATGAFICTAAYEAGKQIHYIFLRSEDDIQPARPMRRNKAPSLRGN